MRWSGLGSWDALHDIGYNDANEDVSSGTVWLDGSHRSLANADGIRVSVHHVDNLLIIARFSAMSGGKKTFVSGHHALDRSVLCELGQEALACTL